MNMKQNVCDKLVDLGAVFNTDKRVWELNNALVKELKNISEIKFIRKSEMSYGYNLILQDNSIILVQGIGEYKKERKESYIVTFRYNRFMTAKQTCKTWKEIKKLISGIKKAFNPEYVRVFTQDGVEVAKSLWK